ncbi:MAG TPA: hypothetical protein VIG99_14080, partial [Myxococcaceae bacterium]
RFDHFTVPKHEAPAQPEDEKARVVRKRGARGNGRPHYGKRFAETEDMVHVHLMNQQLEELAGVASLKLSIPREPEIREPEPAEPLRRGTPIGAFPIPIAAAVPGLPPEPEGLRDLLDTGARSLRLIQHSVMDGVSAGFRLATLPLQAVKLATRWVRSSLDALQPRFT